MLKKIELENYRCYKKSSIRFKNIGIIVGRNNAGKSTIIEALRIIAHAGKKSKTAQYVSPPRSIGIALQKGFLLDSKKLKIDLRSIIYLYDSAPYAKITAKFDDGSFIEVYLTKDVIFASVFDPKSKNIIQKSMAQNLAIEKINILPQIGLIKENEKKLSEDTIKTDKDTYLSSRHFRNELLLFKEDHFEDFKAIAEETWPGLRILELNYVPGLDEYISLIIKDEKFAAEIGIMGSGIQMWIQMVWFISRCKGSDTIILDEPDVYMHPDMQRKILEVVLRKFKQVIIATHSVEIIYGVDAENIITIEKETKKIHYADSPMEVEDIIDDI